MAEGSGRGFRLLSAAIASALLAPAPAAAQVCWWHTSLERCRVLLLTETALTYPLASTEAEKLIPGMTPADSAPLAMTAFRPELAWQLALLYVLDDRTAVGVGAERSVSLDHGEGDRRLTVRVRRQQTRQLALEASAGMITGHAGDSGDRQYPAEHRSGPTGEVRLNFRELVSVGVRYDQLPWRENDEAQRNRYPTGNARALTGVLSLGAKPSVPVNALLVIGIGVLSIWAAGFE